MSASPSSYRPDIDGLRAVAITAVVLFHACAQSSPSGFVGVDIFFVISGYLIGGIIFREIHRREFSFIKFYARRARRILPALICVTLVMCALGCLILSKTELTDLAAGASAALAGVSNIKFFLRNDYFNNDSSLVPMLMTWSLGVEEQFYLIFPFILLLMAKYGHRKTGYVLGAISVISFIASIILIKKSPRAAFYLLPPRMWELGAGALLAIYHDAIKNIPVSRTRWQQVLGWLGLSMLMLSAVVFNEETPFPGFAALLPVVGTLLLIHTRESFVNRKLLSAKPAVFVGKVSYSWYLWHWPLLSFARIISAKEPPVTVMLSLAAISFVIGCVSWRWIEQPFRHPGLPPRTVLFRYGSALAVSFLVIFALKVDHGLPQRLPVAVTSIEDTVAKGRGDCLNNYGVSTLDTSPNCMPTSGAKHAVALLGDSHASALGPGLREFASKHDLRLIQLTKSDCTPLENVTINNRNHPTHAAECSQYLSNALQRIVEDPSITIVLLAARWPASPNVSYTVVDGPKSGQHLDGLSALKEGLLPLLEKLSAARKKVLIIGNVPEFDFRPPQRAITQYISLRLWLAKMASADDGLGNDFVLQSTLSPRNSQIADYLQQVATDRKNIAYVDLHEQFCTRDGCRFAKNGNLLFIDKHHLSVVGSKSISWDQALLK